MTAVVIPDQSEQLVLSRGVFTFFISKRHDLIQPIISEACPGAAGPVTGVFANNANLVLGLEGSCQCQCAFLGLLIDICFLGVMGTGLGVVNDLSLIAVLISRSDDDAVTASLSGSSDTTLRFSYEKLVKGLRSALERAV